MSTHPHVRNPQQPSSMPIHRYAPFTPVALASKVREVLDAPAEADRV